MKITLLWKKFVFDKDKILDKFGDDSDDAIAAMEGGGGSIRRRAMSLLKRRKKKAAPGQPPSVHSTNSTLSLQNIVNAWDLQSKSMVVGTVAVKNGGAVPRRLALGGSVSHGGKIWNYKPHPWMPQALEAERPSLPSYWASK